MAAKIASARHAVKRASSTTTLGYAPAAQWHSHFWLCTSVAQIPSAAARLRGIAILAVRLRNEGSMRLNATAKHDAILTPSRKSI